MGRNQMPREGLVRDRAIGTLARNSRRNSHGTQQTSTQGKSGLERSTTVGFGSWAVGGGGWSFGWGPQDDEASISAIRRAVSLGVNWIDTAAIYGLGHSEEVVGRAISGIPARERPFIFTKCGLIADRARPVRRGPAQSQARIHPSGMAKASLRRLGVDRIDLYQFHWADATGTPIEDSWQEMVRLQEQGKIRAAGVSNFDVALLDRCERVRHVDSLQPPFSLIRRDSGAGSSFPGAPPTIPAYIVYSPMQAGLLTDSFDAGRVAKLAEDDWRRKTKEFPGAQSGAAIYVCATLFGRLPSGTGPPSRRSPSPGCVNWPGVTGAIVGARSAEQVDGWIHAGEVTLTPQDLEEIARAVDDLEVGTGPSRSSSLQAASGKR